MQWNLQYPPPQLSDLEIDFDSDKSEINFIAGYKMAAEQDLSCLSPQRSPETSSDSSDDDAAAYAKDLQ